MCSCIAKFGAFLFLLISQPDTTKTYKSKSRYLYYLFDKENTYFEQMVIQSYLFDLRLQKAILWYRNTLSVLVQINCNSFTCIHITMNGVI